MNTLARRGFSALVLCFLLAAPALAQETPVGAWKTIDDETGNERSIVEIYEEGGKLFARVTEFFPAEDEPAEPVCENCKGDRKDQPVLGMVIMWDMEQDDDEWSGGRILDPKNGKTYRCKIWIEDNGNLRVRGYLGPFYRTQTWLPVETSG
ncbi:MAG TPA: DUF2147 domain-containing protein [Rhodothermales bacterium]|nr:DUF2147 domain-containing protein [Rhodothermales bacterium]